MEHLVSVCVGQRHSHKAALVISSSASAQQLLLGAAGLLVAPAWVSAWLPLLHKAPLSEKLFKPILYMLLHDAAISIACLIGFAVEEKQWGIRAEQVGFQSSWMCGHGRRITSWLVLGRLYLPAAEGISEERWIFQLLY